LKKSKHKKSTMKEWMNIEVENWASMLGFCKPSYVWIEVYDYGIELINLP